MHHWMPGLLQPLNPVIVCLNTKSAELRGDSTHKVVTMAIKKTKWPIPPMISSGGRTLLPKMLQKSGRAMTAHASKVPCQRWGIYVASFRMMRPWITVPSKKATCAQVAIQAKTCVD